MIEDLKISLALSRKKIGKTKRTDLSGVFDFLDSKFQDFSWEFGGRKEKTDQKILLQGF